MARPRFGGCRACALAPAPRVVAKVSDTTTSPLELADERVHATPAPEEPVVFVHGDVWPGNPVIVDARVHALIDWKTAGVGNPGVDLGVATQHDQLP